MFKSIGKFVKALFGAATTGAQAVENLAGSANELSYGLRRTTEVVADNIIEDLKIDAEIDMVKRQKKLAKSKIKSAKILKEIEAMA